MERTIKFRIDKMVLYLAIATSVLSFSLDSRISALCSLLMYFFWGLTLVVTLSRRNMAIKLNNTVKAMIASYFIWTVISYVIYFMGFYPSPSVGVVGYLLYCVAFYILGFNFEFESLKKDILSIICVFTIAQIILSVILILNIRGIDEDFYRFGAKNQMGQMIGVGIVMLLLILPEFFDSIVGRISLCVIGVFLLVSLLMLKSRTPFIGIAVVGVIEFLTKKQKKKKDYITAILVVIAIICAISYLGTSYLTELFAENKYNSTTGLDNVLSGRLSIWEDAVRDFCHSPIWGVGAWAYIDNFMFNMLRCGGILLAAILLPVSYGKMYGVFRRANKIMENESIPPEKKNLAGILHKMIIYYFVISLMEGYPPLGPGASLFFLWILMGVFDNVFKEENA